jgi:hypothetical protein
MVIIEDITEGGGEEEDEDDVVADSVVALGLWGNAGSGVRVPTTAPSP